MSTSDGTIRLSRTHYPVTVLGPGRRIGIWLQGCSIGCRGCISKDTWDKDAGRVEKIETLLAWMRTVAVQGVDGITISGGEPFEQPEALLGLLMELTEWRARNELDFDILCYSGFPLARLKSKHGKILALLDVIIPEPFVYSRPLGTTWQGSNNQILTPLSSRGERKYRPFLDGAIPVPKSLQFTVENGPIMFIGVPGRGDMERLQAKAEAQGLRMEDTSWC